MIRIFGKWIKVGLILALIVMASMKNAWAEEAVPSNEAFLKEVGISLIMPALLNVNLGFWGTKEFPWVARVSGMYYGNSVKGLQTDVGYLLSRTDSFKHYVGVEFISLSIHRSESIELTGAGPSYGLNFHGFSAQVGLAIGTARTTNRVLNGPQLTTQVGYSVLW